MKAIYSCTGAMLAILAGAAIFRPHVVKAGPGSATTANSAAAAAASAGQKLRLADNYGKLPLGFEANQGQTDSRVKFLSRGRGYSLFLTGDEAVLTLGSTSQNAKVKSQKAKVKAGVAPTGARSDLGRSANGNVAQPPPFGAAALPDPLSLFVQTEKSETEVEKPRDRRAGPALPLSSRRLADSGNSSTVLRMRLVGANASAAVTGAEELPGKSNYFIGNDPKKWRTNVPNYAKVKYQNVYPGVDLVYYGNQGGQLEYDFVVAPGADPTAIRLALSGALEVGSRQSAVGSANTKRSAPAVGAVREPPTVAAGLPRHPSSGNGGVKPPLQGRASRPVGTPMQITADGDLIVKTDGGEVRFHKPLVYQKQSTVDSSQLTVLDEKRNPTANSKSKIQNRKFLDGHYVLQANNQIGFEVPLYDHTRPLVIDPVLTYSTYLGGSGNNDAGQGVAVDGSGNAYVVGTTDSADFPTVNPLPGMIPGRYNAFVTKINAAGSALVYSTYLGGSGPGGAGSGGASIAVDSSGNAYVTGSTFEVNFPTVNPLPSPVGLKLPGLSNAFVSKLNPAGSGLVYSTYLAGNGDDFGLGIAVDSFGHATVTGATSSDANPGRFPTVNALQPYSIAVAEARSRTGFVAKLASTGSTLVYSTYLGGSDYEYVYGVAVDPTGDAYVTGITSSPDFPTVNPLQTYHDGGSDAFVAKLNPAGSALVYSTYLGGSGNDAGSSINVDSTGNAYVTGTTSSTDFPTTPGSFQSGPDSTYTAGFIAKLNAAGSALVYSTYLHGTEGVAGAIDPRGIGLDAPGDAYLTGFTCSTDFPTVDPIQATNKSLPNNCTAFVTELSVDGSALVYSSYLGGSGSDVGNGIAVDASGNAYVGGETTSTDFPTTPGTFQTANAGGADAFVTKISPTSTPQVGLSATSLTFGPQGLGTASGPQTENVTNTGTADLTISTVTVGGTNAGDFATSADTCTGATLTPTSTCTVSVTFSPSATGSRSASLNFTDNASNSPQSVSLTGAGTAPKLVITASSASMTYGGGVPGITASYAGFLNGNTAASLTTPPTCSTTATSSSPVGSYPSTCSGAVDANYTISYTPGTVTVGKAPLTITASSAPMTYGGAVPAITAGYAGFVNGNTAASLTTAPTCSTTATSSSPVGSYPSTCSGAVDANYTISYTAGTVTVGKAPLTITAPSPTITAGSTIPSFTPTYNGFVNGQTAGSLTTQPVCTTTATTSSPAGTYPITCSGAVGANYNISYVAGVLTITGTGTAPVISFSPQILTFGNQPVGTTSNIYYEIVTNTGTGNLTISDVTLGGANAGDFAQTFAGCSRATLPPNSNCTVTLTFAPSAAGTRSASLSFTDNASNSPQTVAISGAGVQGIVLNPATLVLGYQSRNTTSPARVVTLANTLNTAMAISISTSGDFAQTNTCGGSVPARGTCTISVTFTPTIVGLETGTLSVTDAAANSPQTAALSGRGVL